MTIAHFHLIVLGTVFLCTFGGAVAGLLIRTFLPAHHVDDASKSAVNVAAATVSVLTALVITSLITSARSAFETTTAQVEELSANLILLDRVMARYGFETDPARDLLRQYTALKIDLTWPNEPSRRPVLNDPAALDLLETIQGELRALEPQSDAQRWLQSRALQVSGDLAQTRWKLAVHIASVIPLPFLMVVVAWLAFLFASFGLFAPRNPTVVTVLAVAALSVSAAIVLILELDDPFEGFITISDDPMRHALEQLLGRAPGLGTPEGGPAADRSG